MSDFFAALGLVLVFEGLLYGGLPRFAKRMAADVLRVAREHASGNGLVAMVLGVFIVWLVRG